MTQAKVITKDANYADRAVAHNKLDGIDCYTVWLDAIVTSEYTTRTGKTLYHVTLAEPPSDLVGTTLMATEVK